MSRLLRIGLFVLVATVGTVVYMMRTADRIQAKETYTVEVIMDDASGLYVDSNVRLAGVNVGKIRSIELLGEKAKLTLELSKDVQLFEDAKVVKTMESMLGNSAIQVYPGTRVEKPLPAGGVIQNTVSANVMDQTFMGAAELTAELQGLVKEMRKFLSEDGGYSTLQEILTAARDITKNTDILMQKNLNLLASALEDVNSITETLKMNTVEDRQRLSEILKNTADITYRIDQLLAENQGSLTETLTAVRESVTKLQTTIDQVNETVTRVNSGEGTLGKLVTDESLYNSVTNISSQVEGYINSTMGMELQIGFQSELLIEQMDARNQLDLRINPVDKSKYYLIGVVDSPRLSETETETTTTQTVPPVSTTTTTVETERKRKLLINAQIARRFGNFGLRGGLLESTGGVALDFYPFNGLALSTELFDFTQDGGPYLRAYGTIYPFFDPRSKNPFNWLYLTGGINNALVEDRDFFMGMGVRFTDNDLKGLAGSMPNISP